MASFDTLQQLAEHPEWIAPRSDARVFIGEPGAPEATKTTIEPGNVFSPGMRSFGVTWWLRNPDSGAFFATETVPLDALCWSYEDGHLPLIHCTAEWEGLSARHSLFQDGTYRDRSEVVYARLQLTNNRAQAQRVQVYVALRSLGPAGGPIPDLTVTSDKHGFALLKRGLLLIRFDAPPDGVGCGVGDPSPLAMRGDVPQDTETSDANGWCFGLARFGVTLQAGETSTIRMVCPVQTRGNLSREMPSTSQAEPAQFEQHAEAHLARWRARLNTVELDVPDPAFKDAFRAGLQHMLVALTGDQARIAPLSYPLPWLRDSIYIIRCFDLAGLHDEARAATGYCARNDFFGGFGAEGDAPGQGIWALVQHYRVTQDDGWLASVYPAIQRKCDWLFRMRRTDAPIQVFTDTPVLAFTHEERAAGVICLAAQDGIIMGAMDHGVSYSLGWVNHWALVGLEEATFASDVLGHIDDAARYRAEADELRAALRAYLAAHPDLWGEERTVNSLLWPTRAWTADEVRDHFLAWWRQNRARDGAFQPEPYWLYFESAQAHNALLMGELDTVWQVLDYRLTHQDLPGLYGWREGRDGVGTDNAVHGVTLIPMLRGCHIFESITPHGWSQAELWLLQRAVLVDEWDNALLLFGGVPQAWLQPSATIAFRRFPTWYGAVSASLAVSADGETAVIRVDGARAGTRLRVRINGEKTEASAGDGTTELRVFLKQTQL